MAGYSGTPLVKKLGIRNGARLAIVNAPGGFWDQLIDLPEDITSIERPRAPMDFILFFTDNEADLLKQFPKLATTLAPAGMLWIGWPKKTSRLSLDPAFNENRVRRIGLDAGLVDVKVCAIDGDWSGLKFVRRVKDREG
jgi:hypothetical protein